MNILQRTVLIVGAIALLVMLATTGTYQRGENGAVFKSGVNALHANLWDWQSALIRAGVVSIATAAVYFAVGKRK